MVNPFNVAIAGGLQVLRGKRQPTAVPPESEITPFSALADAEMSLVSLAWPVNADAPAPKKLDKDTDHVLKGLKLPNKAEGHAIEVLGKPKPNPNLWALDETIVADDPLNGDSSDQEIKATSVLDAVNVISRAEHPTHKANPVSEQGQPHKVPDNMPVGGWGAIITRADPVTRHRAQNGQHYWVFANPKNNSDLSGHNSWTVFSERSGRLYSVLQSEESQTKGEMLVVAYHQVMDL